MNLEFDITIQRVIDELPVYAAEAIKEKEKEVSGLLRDQITSGFRGDGKHTLKYISNQYVKKQQKRSTKSYPYRNYYVNGNFQGEIFVENTGNDKIYTGSYHRLVKYIEPQEENLFSLQNSNDKISELIKDKLTQRVRNELSRK